MKKRLLITSIVMMLVVAVALGTSTYAWFTSSNAVTADSITLTAAINTDAALEISYLDTEGTWLTKIEAVSPNPEGGFNPAAPSALTIGTSYYGDITWATSKVINGKFITDGTGSQQYVWHDNATPSNHESFFLHNGSTANPISGVEMSATITGPAAPFIRIGVFKKDSTGYKLIGVISNLEKYEKATSFAGDYEFYKYSSNTYVKLADSDLNLVTENDAEAKTAADFAKAVEDYGMIYKRAITVVEATTYESGVTYYTDSTAVTEAPGITDATTFASVKASNSDHLYKKTTDYTGVAVGAVEANGVVETAITPSLICTKTVALGGLAVNNNAQGGDDEMELKVAVWMDGSALNDDTAGSTGKTAQISLSFSAAR